jgi:hypothetical protein
MRRSVKQKVFAGAAVAVLIGGGSLAAVSATGQRDGHRRAHARHGADRTHGTHRVYRQDLLAAAAYLGISAAQLERELRASGSLAKVAEAHAGKSPQGLIEAIVTARRSRLAKAIAKLPTRVGAEVNGPARLPAAGVGHSSSGARGAPRRRHPLGPFTATGRLGASAASYLGISSAAVGAELLSGKTLAQIAEATPGKSSAGLVDALVAAVEQRLKAARAAGRITPARAARREQRVRTRVGALVQRKVVRPRPPG